LFQRFQTFTIILFRGVSEHATSTIQYTFCTLYSQRLEALAISCLFNILCRENHL